MNKWFLQLLRSALLLNFWPMKTWNLLTFWTDSEHSSMMKRSQGLRCMTAVSHLKKAKQRLKTCENYTFCRESYGQFFRTLKGFIHRFSDTITNHQRSLSFEASKRPSKATSLSFKTTRSISQKRLSPPRQLESAHLRCDNRKIGGNSSGGTATPRL